MANDEPTRQPEPQAPAYRVIQKGRASNIDVSDFDSLVTHHPGSNANARVVEGVVVRGEAGRRHALISGGIDEIAVGARGGANGLAPDQVLQKKDFILENPTIRSGGPGVRDVDVPSPFAGYVGRVGGTFGTVDIYDREGGRLLARVLHLDPINVTAGSTIEYGQALGVQNNKGLPSAGKHVHMEVDTAHYQAYENYVDDLVSGRLPMNPQRRAHGIEPRPVVDDGVIRIGESSDRVRHLQRHLNDLGMRDANGQQLPVDGIYRVSMQAAVLRFQEAQGLPATGDIDAATLRALPQVERREVDRLDHGTPAHPPSRPLPHAGADPDRAALDRDPLHSQAEAAVRTLDHSLGRGYDDASARMAASLVVLARGHGLNRIDHVVLSEQTSTVQRGENVFVVQGRLDDAAHRIAYMKTQDAVGTPVERSAQQFHTLNADLAQQHEVQPQVEREQAPQRMTMA